MLKVHNALLAKHLVTTVDTVLLKTYIVFFFFLTFKMNLTNYYVTQKKILAYLS